jgi:quercetin dioxygenase-like cupin family protein
MLVGELELIFDDETIVLREGDTLTVPPNVWHEAKSVEGGKMLTIFKNGQFDIFLEELSTMNESDFADEKLMTAFSAKFDIYEETK